MVPPWAAHVVTTIAAVDTAAAVRGIYHGLTGKLQLLMGVMAAVGVAVAVVMAVVVVAAAQLLTQQQQQPM